MQGAILTPRGAHAAAAGQAPATPKRIASTYSLPFLSAFGGPVKYQRTSRPWWATDERVTQQTVEYMARYAVEDSQSAPLLNVVPAIRAAAASSNPRDLAAAVHQWMREHVRFAEDSDLAAALPGIPLDAEVLVRPADLLSMPQPQGDCDDFSMTTAALLINMGIPAAFKTVAADQQDPGYYSHVFVLALLPGHTLALDSSHGPYAGFEVTPTYKAAVWPIGSPTMRRTLAGITQGPPDIFTDPSSVPDPNIYIPDTMPSASVDWTSILNTGMNDASKILGTRYSVPQLNAGQYIRQANGTILYQAPAGNTSAMALPGLGVSAGSEVWLIGGAVLIFAVLAMSGKGHN